MRKYDSILDNPETPNEYGDRIHWNNFITNAQFQGFTRKTEFLWKLAIMNKLAPVYDYSEDVKRTFISGIDKMISALKRTFPGNWEFKFFIPDNGFGNIHKTYRMYLVIRFPEVKVTNSNGLEHTTKDLFIKLKVNSTPAGKPFVSQLQGTTAHYSYVEFDNGWVHSHLRCITPGRFDQVFFTGDFCTRSNECANLMSEMELEEFDEGTFELFLHNLITLVSWESLEGVPYNNMSELTVKDTKSVFTTDPHVYKQRGEKVFNSILSDLELSKKFDYGVAGDRFFIKNNSKFKNVLTEFLQEHNPGLYGKIVCTEPNERGTRYAYSVPVGGRVNMRPYMKDSEFAYTVFRGEKVYFKRGNFTGVLPEISNYVIHPNILKDAAARLEKSINHKKIARSAIENYTRSNYRPRDI